MIDDFRPVKRPAPSVRRSLHPRPEQNQQPTEEFQTPEETAHVDEGNEARFAAPIDLTLEPAAPHSKKRKRFAWRSLVSFHWPPGRREATAAIIAVLVLTAGGASAWQLTHRPKVVKATHVIAKVSKPVAKPTTVPSVLSGLPVDPTVNARPVTGVMIENSVFARPQAGLSQASVVFEAIAEGGITRFLALYQDNQPENVGPIRSARPYYVQWALGFDASLAHVGGSPEALADIKAWGVKDLDQFHNGGSYHRVSSREAPHNVYTALSTLNQLEASKGTTGSQFTSLLRKAAEAPSKSPDARSVNLAISGADYNVHYDYNAATNTYNRVMAGKPHIDANTNTQISPKVVVAMVMPYSLEKDGYHSDYTTIGSGQVFVFQDGTVRIGQWSKTANASQFSFTDSNGQPLGLNPGQTWLTAVKAANNVTYSP